MQSILAKSYISIPNRSTDVQSVKRVFDSIINALPTQIGPFEREALLEAILSDLSDEGVWKAWSPELYLTSLTAIKVLGRNPMGSETLLETRHLNIVLGHSQLPFPSTTTTAIKSVSPQALESLRILANTLVLHSAGRNRFAKAGGARAIARALASKDADGEYVEEEEESVERLFLIARIGFLVTVERKEVVGIMVDEEDIVDSLVHYLNSVPPIPANFNALSEILKLTNNVLRFYPYKPVSSSEEWDERFDALLWPTLCLLHAIPFSELAPPLSHTLHVLLAIPFTPNLVSTWHSLPQGVPSPTTTSPMRNLLNRLGSISSMSISNPSSRKSSAESASHSAMSPPPRTPSPSGQSTLSTAKPVRSRTKAPCARRESVTAFVTRVLGILQGYLDRYIPWPKTPDSTLETGLVVDEGLPPIFLLLSRAAEGSEPIKLYLKELLLPADLDRSPEAGPLEKRKGLLGTLLRFMACTHHPQTKDTAGELLWGICDKDASTLSAEIGYGNAAGLLFRKGITAPPPGKITEIDEPLPSSSSQADPRHPITALKDVSDNTDPFMGMTDEEKEREAERLFTVFDKLNKNPVISTKGPDGKEKSVKEAMIERYQAVDEGWGERELLEAEEAERRDEEEVRREMEAYKARKAKS